MRLPSWPVQSVLWPIRAPLHQRSGVEVCVDLRRGDMDNCLREVGQSTSVIHVQMGEEDVSHVSRAMSQGGQLLDGGLFWEEDAVHEIRELPHCWRRVGAITHSPAGVDEGNPLGGI